MENLDVLNEKLNSLAAREPDVVKLAKESLNIIILPNGRIKYPTGIDPQLVGRFVIDLLHRSCGLNQLFGLGANEKWMDLVYEHELFSWNESNWELRAYVTCACLKRTDVAETFKCTPEDIRTYLLDCLSYVEGASQAERWALHINSVYYPIKIPCMTKDELERSRDAMVHCKFETSNHDKRIEYDIAINYYTEELERRSSNLPPV